MTSERQAGNVIARRLWHAALQTLVWYAAKGGTMTDERTIEARIYERLSKVIDPELGRSVTDLA